MTLKQISNQLQTRIKKLAIERDKLREMESMIGEYEDCANRAIEDLESAVDALSELV